MGTQGHDFGVAADGGDSEDNDAPEAGAFGAVSGGGGSSSSSSSSSQTSKPEQVFAKGEYGTTLYRRGDEAELGDGTVHAVFKFDGVVDYKDGYVKGPVSVAKGEFESFKDSVEGRIDGLEVVRL